MKISVVIPCYNGATYLSEAIESVLRQEGNFDLEIIVSDDGSTDDSVGIAQSYGEPVRVLKNTHVNASHARNRGAEIATGDCIMFFDADDILGPSTLEALTQDLATDKSMLRMCRWSRLVHNGTSWIEQPAEKSWPPPREDVLGGCLSTKWYWPPCAILWTRPAYDKVKCWDESLFQRQDMDILIRAKISDIPHQYRDAGKAFYRTTCNNMTSVGTSITKQSFQSRFDQLLQNLRKLEECGRIAHYRQDVIVAAWNTAFKATRHGHNAIAAKFTQLAKEMGGKRKGYPRGPVGAMIASVIGCENMLHIMKYLWRAKKKYW